MAKTVLDDFTRRRLRERCDGELVMTARLVSSALDRQKWSANFKWSASGDFLDEDGNACWDEIVACLAEALEIAKERAFDD